MAKQEEFKMSLRIYKVGELDGTHNLPVIKEVKPLILCTLCGIPVSRISFRDERGRQEWRDSGKCERCQDALFGRL